MFCLIKPTLMNVKRGLTSTCFCNPAVVIFCTNKQHRISQLYKLALRQWSEELQRGNLLHSSYTVVYFCSRLQRGMLYLMVLLKDSLALNGCRSVFKVKFLKALRNILQLVDNDRKRAKESRCEGNARNSTTPHILLQD